MPSHRPLSVCSHGLPTRLVRGQPLRGREALVSIIQCAQILRGHVLRIGAASSLVAYSTSLLASKLLLHAASRISAVAYRRLSQSGCPVQASPSAFSLVRCGSYYIAAAPSCVLHSALLDYSFLATLNAIRPARRLLVSPRLLVVTQAEWHARLSLFGEQPVLHFTNKIWYLGSLNPPPRGHGELQETTVVFADQICTGPQH